MNLANMVSTKAQGGTEMLIILALALGILVAIFATNTDVMSGASTRFRYSKARAAVNDIGDAAKLVYEQGTGSRTKVYISLPNSIDSFTASGETIAINFKGNDETVYRNVGFEVNGTLPTRESFYWICIEAMEDNVQISNCAICGDNATGLGEGCDSSNLNQESCFTQDFERGNLSCNIDCTLNVSHCIPNDDPVVQLVGPANDTTFTDTNDITFSYNVTDATSGIANCSLVIDGTINLTTASPAEDTELSFLIENMPNGNYTWRVDCTDDSESHNSGSSETWTFEIDTIAGFEWFPNSILVFSNNTHYEIWYYFLNDSATWKGPRHDTYDTQNWLNYVVGEESPTRNEYIIATVDTNSMVQVQVLSNEIWHHNLTLTTNVNAFYRGVDVAYETISGDGLVVTNNGDRYPLYYTWNGSVWSDAITLDLGADNSQPNWVILESDPNSDEIVLVTLHSNSQVVASIWNGTNFTNTAILSNSSTVNTRECIAVAYEQQSSEAMFVWNENADYVEYRQWDGSSWDSGSNVYIPAMHSAAEYLVLDSNPFSDEIMLGVLDGGKDLNTREWSGSAWDAAHTEITDDTETSQERCFDISYETAPVEKGNALLVFGPFNIDGVAVREWNESEWVSLPSVDPYPEVTDMQVVQLTSNYSGAISFLGADDANDLHHWNFIEHNETWITAGENLGELDTTLNKVSEPFDIAFIWHDLNKPASVTNLANQSQETDWIYWTWTNPTNLDFNESIVYLDGVNVINTSNGYYNATSLSPDTNYTLTVHTKDINGNINDVDVNSTAKTTAGADVVAPASVTGLANASAHQTWIYWNWTNPTDMDFDKAIVYIHGVWKANTSNNYYNATSLSVGVSYTITVHTKDTTGNVNNSDINSTASTLDLTPPASVTNLQNQSQDTTWIYWTWTNPGDADFSQSIVYLDDVAKINTSNNYYNATGLTPDTSYTLKVHTKDTKGNVNNTDVTSTVSTLAGADVTPPASVTNLANQSQDTTWIYWTWTNPGDADFSAAIVYLDGVWKVNTSNAYYNATGLSAETSYTITVHTKDVTGNINSNDVNDSATTSPTPPSWSTEFFDDFNRANSGTVGGSWTETGGEWDILSNRAHADNCDSPGDQITSSNIDLSGKTNSTLTFDWQYDNFDSGECLNLDLNDGSGWQDNVFSQCSSGGNQDASGSQTVYLLDHISLTSTVQLRYDCLSSHTNEEAYIDNVNVSGYG